MVTQEECQNTIRTAALDLEGHLVSEHGNRPIPFLAKSIRTASIHGHLFQAVKSLCDPKCQHIVLLVGNTCNAVMWPPTGTDGPAGTFALANTLMQLNKKVTILCDQTNHDVVYKALVMSDAWKTKNSDSNKDNLLQYISFASQKKLDDENQKQLNEIAQSADHIVNIGRPGPGHDGKYYTHDKRDITFYQPPFAAFFDKNLISCPTTCIGEYGNELGMGKVYNRSSEVVPHGKVVCCEIESDFTIVTTVLDTCAYAMCSLIILLEIVKKRCESNIIGEKDNVSASRYFDQASSTEQTRILSLMVKEGARCGITGTRAEKVSGYDLRELLTYHDSVKNEIFKIESMIMTPTFLLKSSEEQVAQ